MDIEDTIRTVDKIKARAHSVLEHLMKLAYNESMRYRKAHIKILNELRNLYNSVVSMEIRTGLRDILRRRVLSAKKAIPGKPRATP
nr:TPA: hypothetical protein PAB0464 [Pyrococcus abyssi GE5]